MTMRHFIFSLALAVAALALPARAQECAEDAQCPEGFSCQAGEAKACPAIACAEGQECPVDPDCGGEPGKYCQPVPCTSNDQCADGMVCYAHEGGADDPKYCVPRWAVPCTQAADCGEGFECVPEEQCACGGSTGSAGDGEGRFAAPPAEPPPDGGSADPAPPQDAGIIDEPCVCEPTGVNVCELKELPCTDDSQCPADFTCEAVSEGVSSDCAVPEGADASACEPIEPAPPAEHLCLPPFVELFGGSASELAARSDTQAQGGGTSKGPSAEDDASATPTPASSGNDDDCSVQSPGRGGRGAGWLAFALLAFAFTARRARTRR